MQNNEQAIAAAQERQAAIEAEADRTLAEAKAQADAHIKTARDEAAQHVDSSRLAAEKIRRESERELQAATARRDAITAQLTNVRQMLATLGDQRADTRVRFDGQAGHAEAHQPATVANLARRRVTRFPAERVGTGTQALNQLTA